MAANFPSPSEFDSNVGNANLAVGSGQSPYIGNPAVADPFSGVNDTLKTLQAQENARHDLRYKQSLDQQDKLAQTLAATGGSVANAGTNAQGRDMSMPFLQQDQDVVNPIADDINKQVHQDPDNYQNNADAQNKARKLQQLVQQASLRTAYVNNMHQLMATHPDEIPDIQKNLQDEVFSHDLKEFHAINPYLPKPKIQGMEMYSGEGFGTKKEDFINIDKNRDVNGDTWTDSHSIINPAQYDIRGQMIPGTPKYNNALEVYKNVKNNQNNQPYLSQLYNQANNANTEMQNAGVDPSHYHNQVVVKSKDANGNDVYSLNPNATPQDVAYNVISPPYMTHSMTTKLTQDGESDLEKAQRLEINAKMAKAQADAKNNNNNAQTASENIHKLVKDSRENTAWGTTSKPLNQVTAYQTTQEVPNPKYDKDHPTLPETISKPIDTKNLDEIVRSQIGLNPDGYKAITVPLTPDIAMAGGRPLTTNVAGQKISGNTPETPQKVWHIKPNDGKTQDYFIMQFDGGSNSVKQVADGVTTSREEQLPPNYEAFTPEQMVHNYNLSMNSFKPDDASEPAKARTIYQEKYGNETSQPIAGGANVAAQQQQPAQQPAKVAVDKVYSTPPNMKANKINVKGKDIPYYTDKQGNNFVYDENGTLIPLK